MDTKCIRNSHKFIVYGQSSDNGPSKGILGGFPGGTSGKEPTCQWKRHKGCWFDPWVGKIPWRRKWQMISVFLPGEFHGQRSLTGYSLWGHKTAGHHLATNTFTLGDKVSQFALLPSPNLNEMTQAIYI